MVVAGKRGNIGSYTERSHVHVLVPSKLRSIAGAKVKHTQRYWSDAGTPETRL